MVAELYTVFGSELLNYCCMMCRNIGDAQDLLQETVLAYSLAPVFLDFMGFLASALKCCPSI